MQTIRQQIITILEEKEMSARELSKALGVKEKDVFEHLSHIKRSIKAQKKKLSVRPYQCQVCEYVFADRQRLTRPGRCPKCKEGHIEAATFRII